MARNRRELSPIFREILGNNNVYFQSPGQNLLKYPCIIYEFTTRDNRFANDHIYKDKGRYTITLICSNPDNDELIDKILELPYCSHDRRFISENLYHDVFDLFY